MKTSFLLFVAFAISFAATIAFTNPEVLSFDSDTTTSAKAESISAQPETAKPETAKPRRKKTKRRKSDASSSGSDLDSILKSFNAPREKMSKRVRSAPSLDVSGWKNSRPLRIDSLKGRIVVLNFWTTWCGYCVDAIPHNKTLARKYGNKGVVLIGVCTSKGTELMSKIAKENNIRYPIAADNNRNTGKAYKIKAYPRYCVIDANGNLRFEDLKKREVEAAIQFLLK